MFQIRLHPQTESVQNNHQAHHWSHLYHQIMHSKRTPPSKKKEKKAIPTTTINCTNWASQILAPKDQKGIDPHRINRKRKPLEATSKPRFYWNTCRLVPRCYTNCTLCSASTGIVPRTRRSWGVGWPSTRIGGEWNCRPAFYGRIGRSRERGGREKPEGGGGWGLEAMAWRLRERPPWTKGWSFWAWVFRLWRT